MILTGANYYYIIDFMKIFFLWIVLTVLILMFNHGAHMNDED